MMAPDQMTANATAGPPATAVGNNDGAPNKVSNKTKTVYHKVLKQALNLDGREWMQKLSDMAEELGMEKKSHAQLPKHSSMAIAKSKGIWLPTDETLKACGIHLKAPFGDADRCLEKVRKDFPSPVNSSCGSLHWFLPTDEDINDSRGKSQKQAMVANKRQCTHQADQPEMVEQPESPPVTSVTKLPATFPTEPPAEPTLEESTQIFMGMMNYMYQEDSKLVQTVANLTPEQLTVATKTLSKCWGICNMAHKDMDTTSQVEQEMEQGKNISDPVSDAKDLDVEDLDPSVRLSKEEMELGSAVTINQEEFDKFMATFPKDEDNVKQVVNNNYNNNNNNNTHGSVSKIKQSTIEDNFKPGGVS